jgi:hypothetical protein
MRLHKTRLLIGIGVVASVATTSVAWRIQQDASGTPIAFDGQVTSVRYLVHAELQGTGPFTNVAGDIELTVGVKARTQPVDAQTASVEIHWLTHPDEAPLQYPVSILATPNGGEISDDFPVWDACTSPPCIEELEIVVSRDPSITTPIADVSVDARAEAYSTNESKNPPAGTRVVISVEGPL